MDFQSQPDAILSPQVGKSQIMEVLFAFVLSEAILWNEKTVWIWASFANSLRVPCLHEAAAWFVITFCNIIQCIRLPDAEQTLSGESFCFVFCSLNFPPSSSPKDGFSNVFGICGREGMVTCLWSNLGYFGDAMGIWDAMQLHPFHVRHMHMQCTWVKHLFAVVLGSAGGT